MTIIYVGETFPPKEFEEDYEHMQYYRDLYEGNHRDIFPRASTLATAESVSVRLKKSDYRYMRRLRAKNSQQNKEAHYVVVNLSSAIAELPADLINRSLGNVSADEEDNKDLLDFVANVSTKSKMKSKLWAAIVQHQVDGAVAYRIRRTAIRGTWFEWVPADYFFEHDDDLGADLAWIEEYQEESFLRVERQRLEEGNLVLTQLIYSMADKKVKSELNFVETMKERGIEELGVTTLENVTELMCGYVPNDDTLLRPRGRSSLRNVDVIQEEINWTVTRDSIVFEKHGKPKLAIPSKLWESVANQNKSHYGGRFVRNADIEVVSYDENNGAVPMYITWNAQTEQSFKHVSRLIEYMMSVSKTSPTAIGLSSSGGQLSAKAILYEWIQSVIKSEAIREKFDAAMKEAIRKCIILENSLGQTDYPVSDPVIEWSDMLPKSDSETEDEESKKYTDKVQSLETTVRNLHPDWSEKAIKEEIEKIQNETTVDTLSPTFTQPPKTTIGGE